MKSYLKLSLVSLSLFCLTVLLSRTLWAAPDPTSNQKVVNTQIALTFQSGDSGQVVPDVFVIARLTTQAGEPVADADLALVSSKLPEQHARTDDRGLARFHLPAAQAIMPYPLTTIFSGKPGYRAAIAVNHFDVGFPTAVKPPLAANPLSATTTITGSGLVDIAAAPNSTPTILTLQTDIPSSPTGEATVIALLTNLAGEPIVDGELLLLVDNEPSLHIPTNANGISAFHLPAGLRSGDHEIKVIFAGQDQVQPALNSAVLHYHAVGDAGAGSTSQSQRSATSALLTSGTGGSEPTALVQLPPPSNPVQPAQTQTIGPGLSQTPLLTQITALLTGLGGSMPGLAQQGRVWAMGGLALLTLALPAIYGARQRKSPPATAPRGVARNWLPSFSLPLPLWYALRISSIGIALGLAIVLVVRPATGLDLFWRGFIPLVPLLFFVAPGLWRNLCPMATLNQTPRLFNFTRTLTLPGWLQKHGYLVSITLFLSLVSSRKFLFNQNGPALAILILAALSTAFVMGNFFKGKSGWCSSICPLLPIQRIYGQTPFVTVAHAHCQPCLGCTKNCYDLSPQNAYLADLYDNDAGHATYRKFFVGLFPGFIWAFYMLPNPPALPIGAMYSLMALYCLASLLTFLLLSTLVRTSSNKITVLYGALALNLYYWFNAPTLGAWVGTPAPDWLVWPLRGLIFGLTLIWIYRTYRKEGSFVQQLAAVSSLHGGSNIALVMPSSQAAAQPSQLTVTIEPDGQCLPVEKNRTLLEILEGNNLPIEAGCRMGLCGADPICVHEGMDKLSKVGAAERATLERLALAPNTRLACMARVRGAVKIALKPERPQVYLSSLVAGFKYDKAVQKVVIVGNGIAGVTAADHIRRRHPHCEIHLIGRESHHLYNRMGITRLIYGRSAMQGLYLLPEKWYDDFNIICWLNTQVSQIDKAARQVTLGTGDVLGYDRLILTTGSQSYVPPLAGYGLPGVFVLRTAEDAMAIRAFVQDNRCQQAVVAGGGLLGLEAAYGLHKLGLSVTVLERSAALLRRQLDARGAQFLYDYLTDMGIQVIREAEATAVQDCEPPVQRVQQVVLNNGMTLPCDLLLLAAGIRPELALAHSLGLTVQQGVVVDAEMRTSDPQVFAAGDVAEFAGKVYGLWPVAVSQAEVAANNAVAAPGADAATYSEVPPVTMLKVVGIDLTSIGQIEAEGEQELVIALEDSAAHCYRKLIIAEGKIVGAILLGFPQEAPGVTAAVRQGIEVTPHLAALQAGDWSALQALA